MTINSILNAAVGSIQAYTTALQVTSNNVSNVNTPGYSRREVHFETVTVDGEAAGIEISEVRRITDGFLQRELINVSASAAYYDAQATLHERLQGLLGRPDSDATLAGRLDEVFANFGSLAINPEDSARRLATLEDLQSLVADGSRLADQIQALRGDADRQIADEIDAVNTALERIHALNPEIAQQRLVGGDASVLEDQRARAVEEIADILDVRFTEDSDGYYNIFTLSGATLLDRSLRQIQYNPATTIDTTSTFSTLTVNTVDANGTVASNGEDLYPKLRSGSIKGLVDMRDIELPNLAAELGRLSGTVIDQINAVHNGYSAVPPPQTLTGINTGALSTDPHGFTGQTAFAVLDANNEISSQVTIDFFGGGYTTLGDVITAVNAGLTGATMALTNGVLSLSASAGTDGVAVLDDATSPSSRGGRGFAHFFGLNDLLTTREVPNAETGLAGTAAHGFGATGTVGIQVVGPGGQVATTVNLDFSTPYADINAVIGAMNTALSGVATVALDSNGQITTTFQSGYENYDLHVATDTTNRGGTGVTFSNFFSIGDHHVMDPALSANVVPRILGDTTQLATALLNLSAAAGQPALSSGDNTGMLAMQALETKAISIPAAGEISNFTGQISQFAAAFLSHAGQEAARADDLAEDRKVLRDEIAFRRDSVTGVNLDEELANMIIYQNAYNAAARMITTANEMYDTLLTITG
jgi:flagellar hook-associated protein 1 FlgK